MDSFAETIGNILLAHARVKALNRNALSDTRKRQRAKQLATLRQSANRLMTINYSELSESAQASAKNLDNAARDLRESLEGIKDTLGVLNVVAAALQVISNLVGLVQGN
jgi:hypothetical protein